MWNWRNFAGGMVAAGLMTCLLGLTGCSQLSQTVRRDRVEAPSAPPTPPEYATPTPRLRPVPQGRSQMPLLPPPAPPSETSQASPVELNDDVDGFWNEKEADLVAESDEFFAEPGRKMSRERGEQVAGQFAERGHLAMERRAGQPVRLPIITPSPAGLQPVTGFEPRLLPVPK